MAVLWYLQASKQGNANAMFDLGGAYYNGDGVFIDDSLSYAWFVLAKEAGSRQAAEAVARAESDLTPAQITGGYNDIANLCEKGEEVPKNESEAASWRERAAKLGDTNAQIAFANMLLDGRGVAKDFAKARYWCEKAANFGDRRGAYCMGHIYQEGLGVSADAKKARKWYSLAEMKGDIPAMRALAAMDVSGEGAKRNLVAAALLYSRLAAVNDKDAIEQAAALKKIMSANDWGEVLRILPQYKIDPAKFSLAVQRVTSP